MQGTQTARDKKNAYQVAWIKANPEIHRQRRLKWRLENPEKYLEQKRRYRVVNAEKSRRSVRKYQNENPEKLRAHRLVYWAVKSGKLTKHPCYVCGNEKSEGHHYDYTKPLDVIWVCRKHHRQEHEKMLLEPKD